MSFVSSGCDNVGVAHKGCLQTILGKFCCDHNSQKIEAYLRGKGLKEDGVCLLRAFRICEMCNCLGSSRKRKSVLFLNYTARSDLKLVYVV